jgi:protein-arginine kinase activator protein McsA
MLESAQEKTGSRQDALSLSKMLALSMQIADNHHTKQILFRE